jgi:transcriptional regulator with XRE-family HTH domain
MGAKSPRNYTGMQWLRYRMEKSGYTTLQQVAEAAGLHRGNLWRYFMLETRPSIDVLPRLADALEVTILDVMAALEVEL